MYYIICNGECCLKYNLFFFRDFIMDLSRSANCNKRRGTPIPVLPPRIPTPMPPFNNNNVQRYINLRSSFCRTHAWMNTKELYTSPFCSCVSMVFMQGIQSAKRNLMRLVFFLFIENRKNLINNKAEAE